MPRPEQHDFFRAFVLLMASPPEELDPTEVVERLNEAVREGDAARVARELGAR